MNCSKKDCDVYNYCSKVTEWDRTECGFFEPLKTNKEPVVKLQFERSVIPRCFLCESLKLESRTPLMAATKGTFICYDCIETLHETMTAEKKGEKLKLPKGV